MRRRARCCSRATAHRWIRATARPWSPAAVRPSSPAAAATIGQTPRAAPVHGWRRRRPRRRLASTTTCSWRSSSGCRRRWRRVASRAGADTPVLRTSMPWRRRCLLHVASACATTRSGCCYKGRRLSATAGAANASGGAPSGERRCYKPPASLLQAATGAATTARRRCYKLQPTYAAIVVGRSCYNHPAALLQLPAGVATIVWRRCYNRPAAVLQLSGAVATIVWRRCCNRPAAAGLATHSGGAATIPGGAATIPRRRCYNSSAALLQSFEAPTKSSPATGGAHGGAWCWTAIQGRRCDAGWPAFFPGAWRICLSMHARVVVQVDTCQAEDPGD